MATLKQNNSAIYSLLRISVFVIAGFILILFPISIPHFCLAIGPNFDYYSKIKFEYQYSDYVQYEWPEYIEYAFGSHPYSQPNPLLASFPEHRGLTRITQAFGHDLELQLMYHYSFNGKVYDYDDAGNRSESESDEALYNARLEYKINDNFTANCSGQYTKASGDLKGWMGVLGFAYDFGGFFKIEPDLSLFWNKVAGVKSNAQSYNLKLRQALTNTNATQIKYSHFNTDPVGEEEGLNYNTITWWISQWLPTETAVHLFIRYHTDNLEGESMGPGVEISHYIDWATILTLSYRNFRMTNDDPESAFRQQVEGDFISNAFTAMVTRTMWNDTVIALKYRYYTCNQGVKMNTYMFSIEQVF